MHYIQLVVLEVGVAKLVSDIGVADLLAEAEDPRVSGARAHCRRDIHRTRFWNREWPALTPVSVPKIPPVPQFNIVHSLPVYRVLAQKGLHWNIQSVNRSKSGPECPDEIQQHEQATKSHTHRKRQTYPEGKFAATFLGICSMSCILRRRLWYGRNQPSLLRWRSMLALRRAVYTSHLRLSINLGTFIWPVIRVPCRASRRSEGRPSGPPHSTGRGSPREGVGHALGSQTVMGPGARLSQRQ